MGNPYTIEPKLRLWSGRPDALSRDYDPDLVQPWRPEYGLRLKPTAWAAEGFREGRILVSLFKTLPALPMRPSAHRR